MAKQTMSRTALDDALKVLKKSYGAAFDSRGIAEDCYEALPTGYDDLDAIATNGARGIYLGGIVEIFGPEGGGKTSVAMKLVAQTQKAGLPCCWIDAEAGFSPDLAEINGINLRELIMPDLADIKRKDTKSPIPHAGEILHMVYETVMSGAFPLIVVDSVAGLTAPRVLASDYDPNKSGMSEVARILSEQLNKLHNTCSAKKTTVVFVNQIRMKPGDTWNPEDTPGGRALKFFADQRIRIDKIAGKSGNVEATFQDPNTGEEVTKIVGHYARLKIIKNKKAPPSDAIEIPIYYMKYDPDNAKKAFDVARALQVITIRNGTYTWKHNGEVVLKAESEPDMLAAIRGAKMEPYLANCCVLAELDDKNASKAEPVKVPIGLRDLAATYAESKSSETKADDDKKKAKKTKKSLDIDE